MTQDTPTPPYLRGGTMTDLAKRLRDRAKAIRDLDEIAVRIGVFPISCMVIDAKLHEEAAAALSGVPQGKHGLYVASRTNRANLWKALRDDGVPIVSSWIDEAGEGETGDFSELWSRIQSEIASSVGLLFYADTRDAPWKGAFVEIGIALALGKQVGIVVVGELEGRTMRPVGSWIHDSRVTRYETVDAACKAMLHKAGGTNDV